MSKYRAGIRPLKSMTETDCKRATEGQDVAAGSNPWYRIIADGAQQPISDQGSISHTMARDQGLN